ncbi:hypothetical protein [Anaerovibrio sp. JC8]|uniref:hypothetical protein n=1 Tax=Anaerovibrio sp. JC8 TaxID=1240085 RepID=UPI000A117CB4|nr:hypothetical protein [Anaerovibrio sp. JC8]
MEELYNRLTAFPDSYFGFIIGVITYVKQKPGRLERVMDYLNSSDSLTTSDVGRFIVSQPDFHEFGASRQSGEQAS